MSACVICDQPCVPPRRVYCSARCSDVYYTPPSKRTIRQHVERELFVSRETYARQPTDAKSHELGVHIVHLTMWLEQLDRAGGGLAPAFPQPTRRRHASEQQLALPEVA